MTDEAKALVAKLLAQHVGHSTVDGQPVGTVHLVYVNPDGPEAVREIERLREAFLETREMLGLAEQVICEECCPTTWKTADGQPHSPLHEDIRAVLFKHEATRDEARAALGDSHE